jgi:acylphosphatase
MNKEHKKVIVSGQVQGVFFRDSAKEIARSLEIFGTVRNSTDGTVHLEIEGIHEQVEQFLFWCAIGPKDATVTNMDVKGGELKDFSTFEILPDL